MLGVILAYPEKPGENFTAPINEVPMVKVVESRLRTSKRISHVITVVRKDKLKTYSLHVSNPLPVVGRNRLEALLNAIQGIKTDSIFLVEGNMPLVMPFFVNYLSGLFYELDTDAVIPLWRDGSPEVTHAVYDVKGLRNSIVTALKEGYRSLSRITEFLEYEAVSIEELSKRNPKVTLSFFRVKSGNDLRFAETTLKSLGFSGYAEL